MEEKSTATLEKIQRAAMEEFSEKGFQGASLLQIVKQAGVTTGALYGYFSSKEALFASIVEPHAAALMGFRPEDIGYIREAEALGLDCSAPSGIIELSKPERTFPAPEGAAARLGMHTDPAEACSACYASLIHALKRAEEDGSIRNLRGRKIAVGQGYRGKAPEIGIGACCRNAAINVPGCPAKADEIAGMIRSL